MKPLIMFTVAMTLAAVSLHGQVSINNDGSQPDNAAILDLKSTEKGFLPPRLTTIQIWQIADPPAGLMVFNTDSGKLIIFNGTNWHELSPGNCIPLPTIATAGADQVLSSDDTATLQGNVPVIGNGLWTIISGTGGEFSDNTSPISQFWGLPLTDYTLRWSIATGCDTSRDAMQIRLDTAIFVSTHGNNSNPGTRAQPVMTIQQGITLALAHNRESVNIAEGIYAETVSLLSSIHLYGGFDSLTWARNPSVHSTLISGGPQAVVGSSVSNAALDGISIQSANATGPGATSYGVFLANCSGIQITSCSIMSGNGTPGTNGPTGQAGVNGSFGYQGQAGCENSNWPCSSCSEPQGGAGAASPFGSYGGHGGAAGLGPNSGYQGSYGGGPGGGMGGQAGQWTGNCAGYMIPGYPCNGYNGQNGSNGVNGAGGSGTGTLAVSGYVTSNGSSGISGTAGGGGGGGGGGRGGESGCDSYGSGGGGGGSGGQLGTAGTGGTGGGGSFAVWCYNSGVTITGCTLTTGNGGAGGSGGSGGTGGQGGMGAPCGPHTSGQDDGGCGGYGGNGGKGGNGGHGGGGGGGPSIGIIKDAASTISQSGNTFLPGQGGTGGTSSGIPGVNGTSANTNF